MIYETRVTGYSNRTVELRERINWMPIDTNAMHGYSCCTQRITDGSRSVRPAAKQQLNSPDNKFTAEPMSTVYAKLAI
jgi:hypothetical protein